MHTSPELYVLRNNFSEHIQIIVMALRLVLLDYKQLIHSLYYVLHSLIMRLKFIVISIAHVNGIMLYSGW